MCGERRCASVRAPPRYGSSPRVRGTLDDQRADTVDRRFIPACAGNAAASEVWISKLSVHPRVCGERELPERYVRREDGSSPRVRGTLVEQVGDLLAGRFIPACAGNAFFSNEFVSCITVHPRVCGERIR